MKIWKIIKHNWGYALICAGLFAGPWFISFALVPATQFDKATNTLTINWDNGGIVHEYAKRVNRLYRFGVHVRFNGQISSAATLYTLLPNTCATENAVLAFHAAADNIGTKDNPKRGKINEEQTKQLVSVYPQDIQQWIADQGGLKRDFIYLKPPELFYHIPQCQ